MEKGRGKAANTHNAILNRRRPQGALRILAIEGIRVRDTLYPFTHIILKRPPALAGGQCFDVLTDAQRIHADIAAADP